MHIDSGCTEVKYLRCIQFLEDCGGKGEHLMRVEITVYLSAIRQSSIFLFFNIKSRVGNTELTVGRLCSRHA